MGKLYVGVNNIARSASKIYVGVNGIAKQAQKIYGGDANGVARLVYSAFTPYTFTSLVSLIGKSSGSYCDTESYDPEPQGLANYDYRFYYYPNNVKTLACEYYAHAIGTWSAGNVYWQYEYISNFTTVSATYINDLLDRGFTKVTVTGYVRCYYNYSTSLNTTFSLSYKFGSDSEVNVASGNLNRSQRNINYTYNLQRNKSFIFSARIDFSYSAVFFATDSAQNQLILSFS